MGQFLFQTHSTDDNESEFDREIREYDRRMWQERAWQLGITAVSIGLLIIATLHLNWQHLL